MMRAMNWRDEAQGLIGRLVDAALAAADPGRAVERCWPREVDAHEGPVALFAFGKGSVPMARSALAMLVKQGRSPDRGLIIAVPGQDASCLGLQTLVADHPLATHRNTQAAGALASASEGLDERWLALCLVSGGGSAHLASPRPPVTLDELVSVTDQLLRAGATIGELNSVRKHLETLKGGQLAARLAPARVVSLVLSDVLGDRLEVIASGPLAPDASTFAEAMDVMTRFGVVAPEAIGLLERGMSGHEPETPKPGDACFAGVHQRVIANNRAAVDAVAVQLTHEGFEIVRRDDAVQGEAAAVGRALGLDARKLERGQAILAGGETTVVVGEASGIGGRCQELALAGAIEIEGAEGVRIVAFGTDGRDGPTDAAGAWANGSIVRDVEAARSALDRHDSNGFFGSIDGLIETGPTGTNVNDVWVAFRS